MTSKKKSFMEIFRENLVAPVLVLVLALFLVPALVLAPVPALVLAPVLAPVPALALSIIEYFSKENRRTSR